MIWRYLWDYKRVSLKDNQMANYAPIISAFTNRTSLWPPEAFTPDCRIEERIWEWCEGVLKKNTEFMALVHSNQPLDMEAIWNEIHGIAYGGLTKCIFHYWLIENFTHYNAGGSICEQNADWIYEKLKIKGPMPWAKKAPEPAPAAPVPAPEPEPSRAPSPKPVRKPEDDDPEAIRALYVAAAEKAAKGAIPLPVAAGAGEPAEEKDCSVCVTSGNTMYFVKLSDVPKMTHAELRKWYSRLQMFCAESWSPEDCADAERILAAIDMNLRA